MDIKKAVIYARFSTDMQREESIEAQVRACRVYCKKRHYFVTNVYTDEARSGRDVSKREAYNQMMADAVAGLFDVIIFHKIDRNSRNEFNYYSFKNTLQKLGITYEYAAQAIDFTPEGQMMESMLVGMAAYYSRNLSKETKKGLNENAYKGLFNGGRPPLGYTIVDQHYVIVEEEAEAVRLIYNMYLAGKGYSAIAEELMLRGYRTKQGNPYAKNSLYDILGNEKYIGVYTFNRSSRKAGKRNMHSKKENEEIIRVEDAIPSIISKEDFYMVQDKRKANRHRAGRYKAIESYLLSGKIHCACGSAMGGHRIYNNGKAYSYYVCLSKERVRAHQCHQRSVPRELLESWVLDVIHKKFFTPAKIKRLAQTMQDEYLNMTSHSTSERDQLEAALRKAEKKLDNLYSLVEDGAADAFDFDRIKVAKQNILDIKQKLDRLQDVNSPANSVDVGAFISIMNNYRKLLLQDDEKVKHCLIDLLVESIKVEDYQITLNLRVDNFAVLMVPQTGIEPVRISLSEGF